MTIDQLLSQVGANDGLDVYAGGKKVLDKGYKQTKTNRAQLESERPLKAILEGLFTEHGVDRIQVSVFKSNGNSGSGWKPEPSLSETVMKNPGVEALNGSVGMTQSQLVEYFLLKERIDEIKLKNSKLEQRNQNLEDRYQKDQDELAQKRREIEDLNYKLNRKPTWEAMLENEQVQGLLGAIIPSGNTPALAGPNEPNKTHLLEWVRTTDEDSAGGMVWLLNMISNDQSFRARYQQLVKDYVNQ